MFVMQQLNLIEHENVSKPNKTALSSDDHGLYAQKDNQLRYIYIYIYIFLN